MNAYGVSHHEPTHPNMSASNRPTLSPLFTSSVARLTATVLLPTPPYHVKNEDSFNDVSNEYNTAFTLQDGDEPLWSRKVA